MNIASSLPKDTLLHGKSYDYKIIKVLGQGSFGITYLAAVQMQGELGSIDTKVYVAIKEFFMHEINGREGSTVTSGNKTGVYDKYKGKFIKEATNLSKLHHKNIIRVIEAFEANNTVYYTMEYIDGGSLDNLIRISNGLSETETLKYAIQIGDALMFMHGMNMLHLDLKPSNVMIREGEAVLIDFGLSKQYDEDGNPESSTTIGGGTAGYAPLEQTNYKGEKKDGPPVTMDIYAFGATMFKMLTGHKPPVASDILNEGFPSGDLTEKDISQKLIDIITKAMAPLRKDRYQSMGVVLKELKSLGENAAQEHLSYENDSEDTSFDQRSHYPRPDTRPEVVYGGPIPTDFEDQESEPTTDSVTIWVWITALAGLIAWMIYGWSDGINHGDPMGHFFKLVVCIYITVFAGIGLIRADLYRKNKWLWLVMCGPLLFWSLSLDSFEWIVEIPVIALLFFYAYKFNNTVIKLIMLSFIGLACLSIFG